MLVNRFHHQTRAITCRRTFRAVTHENQWKIRENGADYIRSPTLTRLQHCLNPSAVCGVRWDSERTCVSGCATVASKANAALTECVASCSGVDRRLKMFKWFLLPLPPSQHVAASHCAMLLLAWNRFSFGEEVRLICVFLIYCSICRY